MLGRTAKYALMATYSGCLNNCRYCSNLNAISQKLLRNFYRAVHSTFVLEKSRLETQGQQKSRLILCRNIYAWSFGTSLALSNLQGVLNHFSR
uniref:Uncharacterized protein n=1 Tax=Rhipicephalus zambeziensis TaxID=60191 RepID=A0A224Y9T5_9ACAR